MFLTILSKKIEISDADYMKYIDEAREYVEQIDEEHLAQALLIYEDDRDEYAEYCNPQYYKYYSTDDGYMEYLLTYWQKGLYVDYIQARMNINSDTRFEDDDMSEDDRPRDGEDEMDDDTNEEMTDLIQMMKVS